MTAQLGLALAPRRRDVPVVSATLLLWEAAGRPTNTTDLTGANDASRHPGARCWWCGHVAPDGWVRPVTCLPDTFPFPLEAAVPRSEWLCLPCGWTLCDRILLPAEIGAAKIRARAARGGRSIVSVRGAPAARWLVLELADGRVGLWTTGANAAADEPWTEAVAELRAAPRDVGPCRFVEAVAVEDLAPEATEKFRSYHHLAHRGRWWPCTDSDRAGIRAWLLNPPAPPWVAVIGDGKKHAAIQAQLYDAVTVAAGTCVAWFRGAAVTYEPVALAMQVEAAEELIRAGASDEEIQTGRYAPRDLRLRLAIRGFDHVIDPIRGGPALPLVLYLRRNRKELEG